MTNRTKHQVQFKDSRHNIVDTIEFDTKVYRLSLSGSYGDRAKHVSKETWSKFLEDNGVFSKVINVHNKYYRYDGIDFCIPETVFLVTETKDDRPLPEAPQSHDPLKGMKNHLFQILQMAALLKDDDFVF